MAGTGDGQVGWASKLKASLAGSATAPAGAEPPPPPVIEEPAPTPPAEPDPAPERASAAAAEPPPPEPPPPPPELPAASPDPASAYSLLQALTAPPAEPAPPPTPAPAAADPAELPLPVLFHAVAAPPEAAPPPASAPTPPAEDPAERPLPLLFHAAAPPEPAPRPPLQGGYTLLDLAPAPEAPRSALIEALPPPKAPEADLFPMLSALRAATPAGAEPSPAPLRPSPLLDALRTTPPEAPSAEPAPAPAAPSPAAEAPGPKPLPEREVRAVFELLVGRPPQEAELAPLRGSTRRMALRAVILGGDAFREAVLAPAIAAAPRPQGADASPPGAEALEAFGAGAAAEPGMVLDWFGLRTPAVIAPELAAHAGKVLPKPVPSDPRAPSAEWIGLATSLAGAGGTWRGLSVGAGRGDLLLAGGVAARRRGLAIELHATEPSPGAFASLLQHAGANGIEPGKGRFRQTRIGTDPDRRPPGGAILQELLAEAAPWDWVRLGQRGLLGPLLKLSTPLLTERVRFLSLVTHSRSEEAVAIRHLAQAGWRLAAEHPVRLSLADPAGAEQAGAQVWRGPLA